MSKVGYTGVSYPFRISPVTGRVATSTTSQTVFDHIFESVEQIISTILGEREMRSDLGATLEDSIFEPIPEVVEQVVQFVLSKALLRWETRIHLRNLEILEIEVNKIVVKLSIEIVRTQTVETREITVMR